MTSVGPSQELLTSPASAAAGTMQYGTAVSSAGTDSAASSLDGYQFSNTETNDGNAGTVTAFKTSTRDVTKELLQTSDYYALWDRLNTPEKKGAMGGLCDRVKHLQKAKKDDETRIGLLEEQVEDEKRKLGLVEERKDELREIVSKQLVAFS